MLRHTELPNVKRRIGKIPIQNPTDTRIHSTDENTLSNKLQMVKPIMVGQMDGQTFGSLIVLFFGWRCQKWCWLLLEFNSSQSPQRRTVRLTDGPTDRQSFTCMNTSRRCFPFVLQIINIVISFIVSEEQWFVRNLFGKWPFIQKQPLVDSSYVFAYFIRKILMCVSNN